MASVAPWRLDPGESKTLTFALAYGRSEHHLLSVAALRNAADALRAWYEDRPLPPPISLATIGAPQPISPADGALFVDADFPDLSWAAVPGASQYTLDVAASSDFDTVLASFTVDSLSVNPYRLAWYYLLVDQQLFWRVRVIGADPLAISPNSEVRSFGFYRLGDSGLASNGLGIVETAAASGADPCSVVDEGCRLGYGNAVFNDPNSTGDYFVSATSSSGLGASPFRLVSRPEVASPDDYEVRFTAACADDATPCYGLYYAPIIGGLDESRVVRVPFEAWNVGGPLPESTPEPTRLLPIVRPLGRDADGNSLFLTDWADQFTDTRELGGESLLGALPEGTPYPVTDEVFLYMPTEPDGYALFAAAAEASGGAGAVYTDTYGGDPECSRSGAYADFCFRSEAGGGMNNWLVGRLVFADLAGDGTTPGVGTVVRFYGDNAVPPALPSEEWPDEAAAFSLGAPYPNPATDRLTVPYALASEGSVRVSVVDVLGRTVAVLREGQASAGRAEVQVATDRLAPGLYLVVLEADGQRAVRRITVAR